MVPAILGYSGLIAMYLGRWGLGSLAMAAYEVNRDGALRILRDRIPNPLRAIGSCMRVVRWLSTMSVICTSWRKWDLKMVTLVVSMVVAKVSVRLIGRVASRCWKRDCDVWNCNSIDMI